VISTTADSAGNAAKDSILSPLTKLGVQIAATIAVSSFRSSATPDKTLSFRIKRMNSKALEYSRRQAPYRSAICITESNQREYTNKR
jgi:hypothetical protein